MFDANLHKFFESGALKTLVLGTRINLNDFLSEKVFDIKLSGAIPYMTSSWPDEFKVGFEEAKKVVSDPDATSSIILVLCFKDRILAHIIVTTLILRKGSLSNITCRDMFIIYYLVKNELEELKDRMKTIEEGVVLLKESTSKVLQLGKNANSDFSKV
ncbi:hypothetical protein FXO37_22327 [Capsicum annuum]|nr:hypothetical protein FXO37_22327 [Capsicum annuum]